VKLKQHWGLFLSLIAMSYFWFLATTFDLLIYLYAKRHLELGDAGTSGLLIALMLGIGIGSIIAGKVSEGKVELGLVPIGGVGLAISCMLLGVSVHSTLLTALLLSLLGISSGFFIVPLNAYFQGESPADLRGRYLALTNLTSFSAMLLASVLVAVLTDVFGFQPHTVFLMLGVLTLFVAIYVSKTLPGALIRCLNWIITHVFYRIQVYGGENIPKLGGALLVANHVSFIDALLVQAVVKRPVRFLMYKPLYENKFIYPVAHAAGAIPIGAGAGSRTGIKEALEEATNAINNGELVCIFAEGSISRIGQLLSFRPGLERIMAGATQPIIPLYLDQLWGSVFSFREGKFFWKWPKEMPYRVTVNIGLPVPGNTAAQELRREIQELSAEAFSKREKKHQLLHLGFLAQAKRTPFRKAVIDSLGQDLNYAQVLAGVILLRGLLKNRFTPGERVGVLLPPSALGVMANLTLLALGAVPVNLNHTTSKDAFESMIEKAEIKTILTAMAYLEKTGVEKSTLMLPVEALLSALEKKERTIAFVKALVLPKFVLRKLFFDTSANKESLATIVFSSGSTGDPKGVMLTHGNICSNVEGVYELLQLKRDDVVFGSLPLFHSFGITGTMFLPLICGITAVYHPNPVDAAHVTRLIKKHRATMLMTTPTFLQLYSRKAKTEDLKSLRYLVVGAEKLRTGLRKAFEDKFGIVPLEGYGCTELSPVALVNVPDYGEGRDKQTGNKPGSVGRPIPGVSVKIVDPESYQELETGSAGLLLVKGPNVMAGYLNDEAKTKDVMRDGYYITGDIAAIDDEGFVTIQDRLSRFSKIGGEMVPHIRIEDELHEILQTEEQIVSVTAVEDEKKGERLIILTTLEFDKAEILQKLSERGLPNLWIPKADDIFVVQSLPVLGTGKLDLKGLKEEAKRLVRGDHIIPFK